MPSDQHVLDNLYRPSPGRNRRVSSNEQPNWNDGNMDMTWLQPGDVLEMPLLQGPGIIRHIWMTSHAGGVGELDSLTFRVYWDGAERPAIEAPLGMFFAVAPGMPAPVESYPVQVSPTGSLTCYWPMPFRQSARITVTNDNPNRGAGIYWQVDWEEAPDLAEDALYFHVAYRQEYPATSGRDYLIADLKGAGRYVGTVLGVTNAQAGWFGEGDDFFYIDGETVPSLQGTGSEDYFNDAWGFRARSGLWFGQPRWDGYEAGDTGICYRWHLLDPVNFSTSLRVEIEHKGNLPFSEDGFFIERPDYLNSLAYWYQDSPTSAFGSLPPWPDRLPPWTVHHLLQSFQAIRVIGDIRPKITCEGLFGGRPLLEWPNTVAGSALAIPFVVSETDRYALQLHGFSGPDHGTFDIEIDGTVVAQHHAFASLAPSPIQMSLGTHILEGGMHTLAFRAVEEAVGPLQVDTLRLLKLPVEATRPVKGAHEAHFIRLGIGRALYAYRLAYGELPDSLERLVEAGVMDSRYLSDENGNPMQCAVEADCIIVTAPEWSHRWTGLDPRR